MPQSPPEPNDCRSMEEVRAGVDALDAQLVELLSKRFGYMRAAARLKPERSQVRDEVRKAAVIAAVRAKAETLGIPGHIAAELWERLVEASIAYEFDRWDEARKGD